jgi:hypothetical protein
LAQVAQLEDALDVVRRQVMGRLMRAHERLLGEGIGLRGGEAHQGLGKERRRLMDGLLERVGHLERAHRPFGGLAAHLVDLAARQLDGEVIGGGALDQGGGGGHDLPDAGDGPGDLQVAAVTDVADQAQAIVFDACFGQIGHIILPASDAGAFQFLPRSVGKPGRDLEDHYAHIPTRKNDLGPKSDTPHAGIHLITTRGKKSADGNAVRAVFGTRSAEPGRTLRDGDGNLRRPGFSQPIHGTFI